MRILLLSQNYPPEASSAAQKVADMASYLRAHGHAVTVLTAFPNYPQGVVFKGYKLRWRQHETLGEVPVRRSWLHVTSERHKFGPRLLSYVTFAATALVNGLDLGRQDVIYVYAPPTFLVPVAQVLAKVLRARLVVDIHDLWPDAPIALGYVKHPLAVAAARAFERWTLRAPDRVLTYSETHRRKLVQKGVPEAQTGLVPLWIDTKVYHPVVGNEPVRLRREHGLGDAFVVAYTGNIGIPQGLDVLLDAAVELQKRGVQGVKFALVGGGAQRDQLMQRAKEQRLADVVFVPPQPMQAMNAWMAASDALVLHLDHAEFREGTVPGKLFYYMAAGRPVIAAAIGETADVVRACDCGLPVPPRNAVAMADAVQQMAASRKKREQWGRNGRKAALEIYDKERVLAKMEAELVAASASKMRPEA